MALVGIGIAVIVGVGYLIAQYVDRAPAPVAPAASTVSEVATPTDTAPVPAFDSAAYRNELAAAPQPTAASPTDAAPANVPARPAAETPAPLPQKPVDPQMVPPKPAPPPKVAVPDTGVWEYAVALTWVRVRSGPARDSDVLRMIDSAQRVRLGPPQSGWRPVHVGVDRGWVDPRLFLVVPAGKP